MRRGTGRRRTAAGLAAAAILAAGCAATPAPAPHGSVPDRQRPEAVTADPGYRFPIADGSLPTALDLLPNVPREYRGGIHQGVDIFHRSGGDRLLCGEPVLNAREGWVIRADHQWKPMTVREYRSLTNQLKEHPNEEALDRLRGRQVWIRAADGAVFRYCHLKDVSPTVRLGLKIGPGIQIGQMGNSGTLDGAKGTGLNCHLHFEVRPTPDAWLGKGLKPAKARKLYAELFDLP